MTSQEQLAKIGQAALDAKAEGLGLPPRLSTVIRQAEAEEIEVPTAPGSYLLVRDGAPHRFASLDASGRWLVDGLGSTSKKSPEKFRTFLASTARSPERIYTATEAQKLAADAVNLASTKLNEIALRIERKRGQGDVFGYIESIHHPSYSKLLGELLVAVSHGGALHVKVEQ